ncbi:MAG: hypothetical protein QF615_01130 [Planctomycetota bacterium]|jgi:hypothetical protein|nr:hypothetical protein [Planctomycetota bacterium]
MSKALSGLLVAVVALGATAGLASAQDYGPQARDNEIILSFDLQSSDLNANAVVGTATNPSFLGGRIEYGSFLNRNHEVGLVFAGRTWDAADQRVTQTSFTPFWRYHLRARDERFTPYMGIHGGGYWFSSNDLGATGDDWSVGFGASIGSKYWITRSVGLVSELRYDKYSMYGSSVNDLGASIGFAYKF